MSKPLQYPIPWDVILRLSPYIRKGTPSPFDELTGEIAARIQPEPIVRGLDLLPADPRFVLAANHYERKGLWIAHIASVLTQIVRRHYGPPRSPETPSVRWIVTANWPPLRLGPWVVPSPGDWLLPRVAAALQCYPVSTHRANTLLTARTVHRLLNDAETLERPIGIFPEGVTGRAGDPPRPDLPGVGRLFRLLAARGFPVVRVSVSEQDSRFVVEFRKPSWPATRGEAPAPDRYAPHSSPATNRQAIR